MIDAYDMVLIRKRKSSQIEAWILASLLALTLLLNQRQDLAFLPAFALEVVAIGILLFRRQLSHSIRFTTETILVCMVLVALVSNLSYFQSEIDTPLLNWIRFLFPILVMITVSKLMANDPDAIDTLTIMFVPVLFFAIYKTVEISEVIAVAEGYKRQTNWGNVVGALSPFVFLVRRAWLQHLLFFAVMLALVISLKRTAFLVVAILALARALPFVALKRMTAKRFRNLVLFCLLGGGGFYYALQSPKVIEYLERALRRIELTNLDGGSGRIEIWGLAEQILDQSSLFQLVFGRGFGWFTDYSQRTSLGIEALHSDFFDFWVSFGFLGMLLYCLFILRVAYLTVLVSRKCSAHSSFAISTFLVFIVYSLFVGVFFYFFFFVPLFVAIGYLESLRRAKPGQVVRRRARLARLPKRRR